MIGGFIGNPIGGVINASNVFLAVTSGVYTITGPSATFNARIAVTAGSYTINGSAAAFLDKMVASAGSYAITGQAASFNTKLIGVSGTYALTGQTATFATRMPVTAGAYAITGQPASFRATGTNAAGACAITGSTIAFRVTMPCATGVYTLTGSPAFFFETIRGAGGGTRKHDRGRLEIERRKITIRDDEGRVRKVDLLGRFKPPPPFAPAPDWVLPQMRSAPVLPPADDALRFPPELAAGRLLESLTALQDARDENDLVELLTNSPDPLVEDIRRVLSILHASGQLERLAENA